MSQTPRMPQIKIYPDPEHPHNGLMFGAKTKLEIDGVEVKGWDRLTLDIERRAWPILKLEIIGNIEIVKVKDSFYEQS